MKIAISAESTLDLSKELIEEHDIHVIPFPVLFGEETHIDGDIGQDDIYEYVKETKELPRTCALNEFQYSEYFKNLREQYDGVIHIGLSSKLSSTLNNAINAAKMLKNVYVVDSKSLSTGIGLLVLYAAELAEKGKYDAREIYQMVNTRVPHVQASFVINTLNYLHKGGRCSGVAKIAAAVLRIKPQILLKDGSMITGKKYFGKNSKVIEQYCEDVLTEFDRPDKSIAFVTHTQASPEMVEAAKKALSSKGFKKIYETLAGATITTHCGPKTLGILYFNDGVRK